MVGSYTPGTHVDSLIIRFYRGKELLFAARVRAGFVSASRHEVFAMTKHPKMATYRFVNPPEGSPGRRGQGLTAEKIKD